MNYSIRYETHPKKEDIQILGDGIMAHAKLQKQQPLIETFAFFVRDKNNFILGGCNGSIYYACLYIDQLWLDENLREQGIGTQLMQSAEVLGKEKKCLFLTVNTMDWEALDFYKKLGYYVEYERTGYLNHSTMYFLRKSITPEAPNISS